MPVKALNVKHDGGRASRSATQVEQPVLHFLMDFLLHQSSHLNHVSAWYVFHVEHSETR